MSRIDQIHNDYLDPDRYFANEEPSDEPPKLDAYGHLNWTVGDDDWFACFDAVRSGSEIHYHVVVNCESGGFIETPETGSVRVTNADDIARIRALPEKWLDIYLSMPPVKRVYWKKTAKRWNKHIDALLAEKSLCKYCTKFADLGHSCTAQSHGECDCPKCQGFCECN